MKVLLRKFKTINHLYARKRSTTYNKQVYEFFGNKIKLKNKATTLGKKRVKIL